ncbi:MAG: ribosome recycling factor [Oligoflexales bacterium]|nr:ribosome recycling factor [Oligoflexales bacterium]
MNPALEACEAGMKKSLESLDRDFSRVRTGRASLTLLDGIKVNYYGTPTLLNQVASLSTPDARTIVIAPFEKKLLQEIEKSIQLADIGIQPTNDGHVVRLPIVPLNEEKRKEIAKNVAKLGEEAKVLVRKVRQDTNQKIKKDEKDKKIPEDESNLLQKEVQNLTDRYTKLVDEKTEKKRKEVMTI